MCVCACTPNFNTIKIKLEFMCICVKCNGAVDIGFEPRSGKTKEYYICMCCFLAKHAALKRKSKYLLARNQDNVSEMGNMSIHGL